DARPAEQMLALVGGAGREQDFFPAAFDAAEGQAHDDLEAVDKVPRVDNGELQEGLQGQLLRQHDFQVFGRVQGVLVVLLVAGPEDDGVAPAQEADDLQEEAVEGFGLEDGLVDELVEGVEQEGGEGAVQVEQHHDDVPGPVGGGGVEREPAGDDQQPQVA